MTIKKTKMNAEINTNEVPSETNGNRTTGPNIINDICTSSDNIAEDSNNPPCETYETDNKNQQDSAYGSLESSSNGQSHRSYDGSKSFLSGSSHSSKYGDQIEIAKVNSSGKEKPPGEVTNGNTPKEKNYAEKCFLEKNKDSSDDNKSEKTALELPEYIEKQDDAITGNKDTDEDRTKGVKGSEEKDWSRPSLVYTQALNYIRKIKERSTEQGLPFASPHLISQFSSSRQDLAEFFKGFISSRGFTVGISIQDGSVIQVSPSITDILGFPKDMLLGQSFIDFVYPKDSINFSSKIINGLSIPFRKDYINDDYGTFFCRLRMYHGLKSGFGVKNRKTIYKPCKIIFKPQEMTKIDSVSSSCQDFKSSLIIAEIIPIACAYKVPDENMKEGNFSIRHSASCNFSEYDPEAIPYLGHLPQDLMGNSIFDCYHPEDFRKLKKIYEQIVSHQGKPYRSEPYRFRTFNNNWITLITDWLCFVNPWTKKIESIIGQHTVVKGPKDIEIFLDSRERNMSPFPEDIILEAQRAQNEITDLLQEPIPSYQDPSKEPNVKRRRTLADMMVPFVEQMDNNEKKNYFADYQSGSGQLKRKSYDVGVELDGSSLLNLNQRTACHRLCPSIEHQSIITSGQGSLNLSVESPSSYGQLNYSATLQRFFRSNPKTLPSEDSREGKLESYNSDKNEVAREQKTTADVKSLPLRSNSISGSCSDDNNYKENYRTRVSTSNDEGGDKLETLSLGAMPLTVEILSKHNQETQKSFMDCYKKYDSILKKRKHKHKSRHNKKMFKKDRQNLNRMKTSKIVEQKRTLNPSHHLSTTSKLLSLITAPKRDNQTSAMPSKLIPKTFSPIRKRNGAFKNEFNPQCFQRAAPNYYSPRTAQETNFTISRNSETPLNCLGASSGSNLLMAPPAGTFVQSPSMSVYPLQYVGQVSGVFFQPHFQPIPVVLPNAVYQPTLVQPSSTAMAPPPSGISTQNVAEESQDTDSDYPKAKSSKLDITTKDPLQPTSFSQLSHFAKSTSLFADSESIKSLEKQMNDEHEISDILLSPNSIFDKSIDDSVKSSKEVESTTTLEKTSQTVLETAAGEKLPLEDPPWAINVNVTPEMLLIYQMKTQELVDVLREDMEMLKHLNQPPCVEDQLASLYFEMEKNGDSPDLHLEEGFTSTSSEEPGNASFQHHKVKNKNREETFYSNLALMYEGEAPLPTLNSKSFSNNCPKT